MRVLFFLFLINFSFSLQAQQPFFRGPQSTAQGGTGVAGLGSSESVFVNPALIPLIPGYEALGHYRDGQRDAGQNRNAWGATLMDNGSDVALAGTLSYLRLRDTGLAGDPAEGELWQAGFGKDFENRLALGASVYRLEYEVTNRSYTQWNYSLGTVWMPVEGFVVGYVLSNLALPGGDTPAGIRQDLRQTLGTNIQLGEIARLRVDLTRNERRNPDKKLDLGIGTESMTSKFILMRLGYRRELSSDLTFWTAGIGFNGPRLRVDYAFEKNQERAGGALHSVDMTLPF